MYTLPEKEERRKLLVWKVQAQFFRDTHERKKEKDESYYPDTSPPVELWNNRNQPKPICTNNRGPLQVSAVLYNRRTACHQKHNYSRFPTNKKTEQWHYKPKWSACAYANNITYLMCHNMGWPAQKKSNNTHEDNESVPKLHWQKHQGSHFHKNNQY